MEGGRKEGEREEQMEEVKEGERAWRHDGKEKREGRMDRWDGMEGGWNRVTGWGGRRRRKGLKARPTKNIPNENTGTIQI